MSQVNPLQSERQFAVLVLLIDLHGEDHVLFTKRPMRDADYYSGQICFPGGAREEQDVSLADCALRETFEELGVSPEQVDIFAKLGWRRTSIHQRVKPFAGRLHAASSLAPNPAEVKSVLYLPVSRLSPDLFQLRDVWRDRQGNEYEILRFHLDQDEVWGLTARILYDFLHESPEFRAGIGQDAASGK